MLKLKNRRKITIILDGYRFIGIKMKLTKFVLFRNTPQLMINKTIHFESFELRDTYFDDEFTKKEFDSAFNYRRDKGIVKLPSSYENFIGFNYGYFIDGFEKRRYYFFIQNFEYGNDNLTYMNIIIDVVMTFTQGNVLSSLPNLNIERQHLSKIKYDNMIKDLRMNDDTLSVNTLKIVKKLSITFKEFYVLVTSSANFEGDFGDQKSPKLPISKGSIYDNVTSPLNLYCFPLDTFNDSLKYLESFSWIAQNIVKCVMIPKIFIDEADLVQTSFKKDETKKFFKFKDKGMSNNINIDFNFDFKDLLKLLNIEDSLHLLKSNYFNIWLTDYSGNKLTFDPSKVDSLDFGSVVSVGYLNLIKVFLKGYESISNGEKDGLYTDYALTIDDFDELPVFINNSDLSKAKSAYSRELSNSRTVQGRVDKGFNGDLKDKIFNSISVFSSFSGGSPTSSAINLFSSEYEYYRDQKAQFKEMELSQPTVSNYSTPHSLQIKTNDYGITLVIASIDNFELEQVKNYHKLMGYQVNMQSERLDNVRTMMLCNYVKFTGNWKIFNIDVMFLDALKSIFEGGVHLYHLQKDNSNPFHAHISNNKLR